MNTYIKAIGITVVILAALLIIGRLSSGRDSFAPSRTSYHDEQARVYRENEKAAEQFNGRPLTQSEKNELWELSRTDAIYEQARKKDADYDPSQDHP